MPGFDRTGPAGMGPMTGWGRGLCGSRGNYGGGQRFWGFGPGSGRGWGRGWRHRYWETGMPGWGRMYPPPRGGYYGPWEPGYGPSYSRKDELAMLKEEAAWLKEELTAVEERLSELETRQADEG
jgi:hypothetical protein